MDESILYRLKSLNDRTTISIYKNEFKIGRATSKSTFYFDQINR